MRVYEWTGTSLTGPAPALVVSAVFALDVEALGADLRVDLVLAVYLDVRVHDGHHLKPQGAGKPIKDCGRHTAIDQPIDPFDWLRTSSASAISSVITRL